jgi:acyl carrier protein
LAIDGQLVACLVGENVERRAITEPLSDRLPSFMIPQVVLWMEQFPVTAGGKVDAKKLAEHAAAQLHRTDASGLQRGHLEALWRDALGIDVLDEETHFFQSGGDSLAAALMIGQLREQWSISCGLNDIFTWPRLGDFYRLVCRSAPA